MANRRSLRMYWNLGDGPWRTRGRFLSKWTRRGVVAFYLSEAFDRNHDLHMWARKHGFAMYEGDGTPGSKETIALIKLGTKPSHTRRTVALSPTVDAGAGAGPDRQGAKAAHLIGIHGCLDVATHLVPSGTWSQPRANLHHRQTRALIDALQPAIARRPVRIFLDANCPPSSALMDGFRDAGLTQIVHAQTHKTGQPDHVWVNRAAFQRTPTVWAIGSPSDHRAIIVEDKKP